MDRLSYENLERTDVLNTAYALRRVTGGRRPSELLLHFETTRPHTKTAADLRQRVNTLSDGNAQLRQEIAALRSQVERVEFTNRRGVVFTYNEVVQRAAQAVGRVSGFMILWAEHSQRLHDQDPKSPVVTLDELKNFRTLDRFPLWTVQQLDSMTAPKHRWSPSDIAFLISAVVHDPSRTAADLAERCSRAFGVPVSARVIEGKLAMLRKRGRIPAD